MTSPFTKPSDLGGSGFFKPAEHMTALALLVEPKTIEKNVPNTHNGQTRNRDEVLADISVFENQAALDSGQPTSIFQKVKVTHGMLTRDLEKILGGAMVGTVTKIQTKAGAGYVFRDVDSTVEGIVGNYYTNREAAVAEALDNAPSFD